MPAKQLQLRLGDAALRPDKKGDRARLRDVGQQVAQLVFALALVAGKAQVRRQKPFEHLRKRNGRGNDRQHAAPRLLCGRAGDAVQPRQPVFHRFCVGTRDAALAQDGHHLGGSQLHGLLHDKLQLVRLRKRLIQRDAVRAFRVGDAPGKNRALHALRACAGDGDGVFVPLHVGHQKRRALAQPQHAHDVRRVRARDDDAVVFNAVPGDKEQGRRRHLQYPSAFMNIILFSASRVKRLHNIRTAFPDKMSRLDASARRRV